MRNNLTNQQFSSEKKVSTWIWGVISILLACLGIPILLVISYLLWPIVEKYFLRYAEALWFILSILYYMGVFLIAILGLIKGIKGLKSPNKKLAIIGVTLCLIGLVLALGIGGYWGFILFFRMI